LKYRHSNSTGAIPVVAAVATLRVIEHLNVIEHILACLLAGRVGSPPDTLALEQLEEALGHGIVSAVAAAAHAGP